MGVTEVYRIEGRSRGKWSLLLPWSLLLTDHPSRKGSLPLSTTSVCGSMCRNLCAASSVKGLGIPNSDVCPLTAVCGKCGSSVHDPQPCDKPPHCVNCEGDHPANDKPVPHVSPGKGEIQKNKGNRKGSFPEAKRRFQIRNPVDLSRSFSSAAKPKSPGVTASCQTHCTPAVVSHFSCQVSPTDFPEDSACIQGGKIIIPTKYKKPVQKHHQKSTTETSTEIDLKQTPPPRKNTSSKSRPPLSVSENHIGRSSSPYRSRSPVAKSRENPPTISSSSQDDSAVDEEPHERFLYNHSEGEKEKKATKEIILIMALSWNLNGLRAHSEELRLIISRHKPFIVCLQETHLLPHHPLSLRGFNIYRFDQDDGLVLTAALRYSSATPCSRRNTTFEPTSNSLRTGTPTIVLFTGV